MTPPLGKLSRRNNGADDGKPRADGDLEELSSLGHFLKGSSATLGLVKVKDYCEKIQHYGSKKDATGTYDIAENVECLELIRVALRSMRDEYVEVERYFRGQYPDLEVSKA